MQSNAKLARAVWRETSQHAMAAFACRLPLLGLLNKISWLALYLLFIRIVSAVGFVVALWLCPIKVFANLGIYLATINLAALAVFGKYELLIVAAHDERKCADATHLCVVVGTGAVVTALLVAITIGQLFIPYVAMLFAGALFARAWLRLGLTFATRYERYDRAVKALLPHTIGQPITLVLLIYNGCDPLIAFILSDLIGHLIAAACVCISERHAFCLLFRQRIQFRRIRELAAENLGLPTRNLTAAGSAFLFATIPLFFLPNLPNVFLAGTLALLFRVLDIPTSLTNASLGPILMKDVADRALNGTQWISRGIFLLPAIVATVVFGLISLGGLTLNFLRLAPSWHLALTILPVVALFQAGVAATSPLIDIATLAGRQRGLLSLNIISVALAALALRFWSNDPILAIMLAGSIGFARVIAMTILLVVRGEAGVSGATKILWSAFPKIKPTIVVQP
jgi:hypothetical protein